MRILRVIPFIILLSCNSPKIKLSSDFDHGSFGNFKEVKPAYFQGSTKHWLKRDSIGDQYYWFYFKADQVSDKKITFELNDLEGIYRRNPHIVYTDYTQPVYSYDQKNWIRIRDVSYDSAARSFTFSQKFINSPVWIAYAHPYSFQRLESFISSLISHELVTIESIAKTKENRNIELITIADSSIPLEEKKTIFLMAMQHSGEDAGTYYMEGLVNFLLSGENAAKMALEKFVFKLIPMMNPDGVFNGTTRYNMNMEDLNNVWLNDEKMQAEVKGVIDWAECWIEKGNDIDLFLDIHNHTQLYRYNVFIFKDNSLDSLGIAMDKFWPTRIWHSEPEGSSHAYFDSKGIPSGSVELTQSFSEKGDYLTTSDYHDYGKGTVLGLLDYYANDD